VKVAFIYAISAVICSIILAEAFKGGMDKLRFMPTQGNWTVQRQDSEGWLLFDKETGQMCYVRAGSNGRADCTKLTTY
jgi:hypothetical protein